MTNEENLSRLQARQLELLALMGKSDVHAAKCAKLGVKFSDAMRQGYDAKFQHGNTTVEIDNNDKDK